MSRTMITACLLSFGVAALSVFHGCKHDPPNLTGPTLYEMASDTAGFTYYKHSDTLLSTSSGSGHNDPFLRTKFNTTAAQYLDNSGKVKGGTSFAENSLIAKELFDGDQNLSVVAVLYKKGDHEYSDDQGWVWGYFNANGSEIVPVSNRGSDCYGCHGQTGNIDFVLMNKYFP